MLRGWKTFGLLVVLVIAVLTALVLYLTYLTPTKPPGTTSLPGTALRRKNVGSLPKLDSSLSELYSLWLVSEDEAISKAKNLGLKVKDDQVLVMITVTDESFVSDLIYTVDTELGGQTIADYKTQIDAWIPISSLGELSSISKVLHIQKAIEVLPLE